MRKTLAFGLALLIVVGMTVVSCGKSTGNAPTGTTFFPQVSL